MLTNEEIKKFIEEDTLSDRKRKAAEGQRYYEAEHDILNYRLFYYNADGTLVEDKTRSNIKISHPFFTLLANQLSSYMISFKNNPIKAKQNVEGLQEHLDEYFDDDFWAEIGDLITGTYTKGFEYLYAYKNEDDRLAFECADSMGVVEVKAKYTKDGQEYKIYHYLDIDQTEEGKQTIRKIQVWTNAETYFFQQDKESGKIVVDNSVEINPKPHVVLEDGSIDAPLGFIPFWRLDNNKKQFSGLKPIKGIIDDYDLHACSLSNNLKDFDTPLHVVKGFQGDNLDELQQNLKTKKIISTGDAEGDVEVRTIDIPYQARKEKLALDKESIFMFGMGFDPTQVGDGNITNVVIRSRYTLLDLKAANLEKRLKKLLKTILKIVLEEINAKTNKGYQMSDVVIDKFDHVVMTNETENIQNTLVEANTRQVEINTILNVAANIGDEQTLKAICEVMDWDFDELEDALNLLNEEEDTLDAMDTLDGIEPEEDISDGEKQTQQSVLNMLDELLGEIE